MDVKFEVVKVEKPSEDINVIIGYSHFIKTTEDVYEALSTSVPGIKFGFAFCEASGPRLIRYEGNDDELVKYAIENAKRIGAGHFFIIMLRNAYPINVMHALKTVPEITHIIAASANPMEVVVAVTEQGRGIVSIIDGYPPLGVEGEEDKAKRKEFLRNIGYKL